jgi:hypothetical protein
VLTEDALGVTVSVGATTVTAVLAVALAAPLAAVRTMDPVPAAAATTATVAVPPAFTLAGLIITETPDGAVAERLIELVNPLVAPTETVYVVD